MKWVTRERPKIDRIACPWLVARFIDEEPEFLYVPAGEVMKVAAATGAIPYDVPNVELGHHGDRCSFDAFIARYRLADEALNRLALIVRRAVLAHFRLRLFGLRHGKRLRCCCYRRDVDRHIHVLLDACLEALARDRQPF